MRTVAVPGGPAIAVHDLGGHGTEVLLSHAAGFHGLAWQPVARRLAGRFHCIAYDVRGHGDSVVDGDPADGWDWPTLARDALHVVDGLRLHRPLALGHSSGATALLLAEAARPGTFVALYCIEPIGATGDDPHPPMPDHPMAARARRRRATFASREDAEEAYRAKPPLSDLSPEVLHAYVGHGFADEADGSVRLKCRPEHEAHMYEYGFAHDVYRRLPEVACPVVLARGDASAAIPAGVLERWAERLPHGRVEALPGVGHLAPLEDPDLVASMVAAAFDRIGTPPGGPDPA
ncbi:MAG TPA: alpha/beta hydrolase [Acidimicrobiales bacterium]|nr:alpha/beta hydrolase [Acidimicrobiales bacterium]